MSAGRAPSTWRRLLRDRPALLSLAFLALLSGVALLAPLWPLPSPIALELAREPGPPRLAPLFDQGWQHRVTLRFRLDEAAPGPQTRQRAGERLRELVSEAADAPATLLASARDAQALELALFYAPELDPARGSTLEARVRTHLAGASRAGRLLLPGGGELALELDELRAIEGVWDLGRLDRALLALRQRLFGFAQTTHWLGTDAKGRDLLARVVWGSRISLQVALAAALVSLGIGVLWGAAAGWIGGWVDTLLMRIVDALYAIPFLFVVIFVITLLSGYRAELAVLGVSPLTAFYAVLGGVTWLTMARVVRGEVLRLKGQEFVAAARLAGASGTRILLTHLLPNCLGLITVYLTLTIPSVMLLEAFLSFLGLGVEPPRVSWGLLAADAVEAVNPLRSFWWLALWPSLALGATLFALNVLGDGLRDALDPRQRQP